MQFTDREKGELMISGRTKHFLSLCGEHLSIDNMVRAMQILEEQFDIAIPEFTVAGVAREGRFGHRWFLGTDAAVDVKMVRCALDEHLKKLNDDYAVKRGGPLEELFVESVPISRFYEWMEKQGKFGGQNKFPRVLNPSQLANWEAFLDRR